MIELIIPEVDKQEFDEKIDGLSRQKNVNNDVKEDRDAS